MADDPKWIVNFKEQLEGTLTTGEVSEEVQEEIRKAVRAAVISTLDAHGLLDTSADPSFSKVADTAISPIEPSGTGSNG